LDTEIGTDTCPRFDILVHMSNIPHEQTPYTFGKEKSAIALRRIILEEEPRMFKVVGRHLSRCSRILKDISASTPNPFLYRVVLDGFIKALEESPSLDSHPLIKSHLITTITTRCRKKFLR
jgi:hypothetical protein